MKRHPALSRDRRNSGRRHGARGMTLIELLIALALTLLLTGAAALVTVNSKGVLRENAAIARVQDNARFAIDSITHDLRMAGFGGCTGGATVPTSVLTTGAGYSYSYTASSQVQGYTVSGSTYVPSLDTSLTALTHPPSNLSDVLSLRIPTGDPVGVIAVMASSTAPINIGAASGLANGDIVLAANCTKSVLFQITADPSAGTVSHAASGLNGSADLGAAFGTDASLYHMTARSYFVATSAVHPGVNSLWTYSVANATAPAPQELVEGVDAIALMFGEDTNGDGIPDVYETAASVGNWANVIEVRVQLLMSSVQNNVALTNSSAAAVSWSMINGRSWSFTDGRFHTIVNSTVSLRNRVS